MLIEVMPQMGDETKGRDEENGCDEAKCSDKAKINKKVREGVLVSYA